MMYKLSLLFLSTVASFLIGSDGIVNAEIVSEPGEIKKGGHYRYYYDSSINDACQTLLFLAVGTAMTRDDYSKIATDIVTGQSIVTVITDPNPGSMVKLSVGKYKDMHNVLVSEYQERFVPCADVPSDPVLLVGGHSAAGQAIFGALPDLSTDLPVSGFVGLDPFSRKNMVVPPSLPTLDWGFTKTTCGVNVKGKSAMSVYIGTSSDHRVLYRIDNNRPSDITHCVFTDNGCFFVCPSNNDPGEDGDWVIPTIAASIHKFAKDIGSNLGTIERPEYVLPETEDGKVILYVNAQDPEASSVPSATASLSLMGDDNNNNGENHNANNSSSLVVVLSAMILISVGFFVRNKYTSSNSSNRYEPIQ